MPESTPRAARDPLPHLPAHSRPLPPTLRETPVADPAVPRMELADWAERYGLVAGITTREHGFSLGLWSEENVGQVMTRWRAFRAAFHPAFPVTVLSHQIHGSAVRWHDELPERSEEHTSELQSPCNLVCRLLLEKKKKKTKYYH